MLPSTSPRTLSVGRNSDSRVKEDRRPQKLFLRSSSSRIPLCSSHLLFSFLSMDALLNSALVSKFSEAIPVHHASHSSIRANLRSLKLRKGSGSRVLAPGRGASDESGEQKRVRCHGIDFSFDENATPSQETKTASSVTYGTSNGGGTRAGLFRTPISGGVQSATSAHGLPRPALAVRNLMEQTRFAHLCTVMSQMHHHREGYPFGSLVEFTSDPLGHPIFSFSPLAIHTRNLLADPRCTLVVQVPGWSGLSNARVSILGDVFPLPAHQQGWAHSQYIAKHQQGPSQQWENFYYFRMQNISDIYFVGGFGTVAWVDVKEYENIQPDKVAVDGGEQNLKEMNATFSKPLKELLSSEIEEVDDAALISMDSRGIDIRVRQGTQFNIRRLSFQNEHAVETLEEAKAALQKLIDLGQVHHLLK